MYMSTGAARLARPSRHVHDTPTTRFRHVRDTSTGAARGRYARLDRPKRLPRSSTTASRRARFAAAEGWRRRSQASTTTSTPLSRPRWQNTNPTRGQRTRHRTGHTRQSADTGRSGSDAHPLPESHSARSLAKPCSPRLAGSLSDDGIRRAGTPRRRTTTRRTAPATTPSS